MHLNCQHLTKCLKHTLLGVGEGGGGQWGKMLIPCTFNILIHFLSFSLQIIHLKNVDVHFVRGKGGGGSEKVCFVYSPKC